MCGRLNVIADPLARVFVWLTGAGYPGETAHNVAPTQTVWVVAAPRLRVRAPDAEDEPFQPGLARPMRWWLLPRWAKDAKPGYAMFNARAESIDSSRAFGDAFLRRRCIVPISGFYEWIREGKRRLPQHVLAADGEALLLAGVWEHWSRGNESIDSFAIVTTAVHEQLAFLHDRQPLMFSATDALDWLAPETPQEKLQALLAPALPVDLTVVPVSEYVNNARHGGAECLDPTGNPRFIPAAPRH